MATVPPGNKQLGAFTNIVVTGIKQDVPTLYTKLYGEALNAVAYNSNNVITSVRIANVLLGAFTSIITTKVVGDKTFTRLQTASLFAVVGNNPPNVSKSWFNSLNALVKSTDAQPPLSPFLNKMIGAFSTTVVTKRNPETTQTSLNGASLFVVVKLIKHKKDLVTFNVEYAANAEFNIPDLPN